MEEKLAQHRTCAGCNQPFTLVHIGPKQICFYVHTGDQLDRCTLIGDDQQWVRRITVALERLKKRKAERGDPVNADGMPKIFGE
jgi:hypothetical protein